jgi:hypothetical protein
MAPHEIGLPPGLPLDQAGLGPPFMGLGPPGLLQPPLMPGPPANILIRHLGTYVPHFRTAKGTLWPD